MGVAVNQTLNAEIAEALLHCFGVDVHDVWRFAAIAPTADGPGQAAEQAAPPKRAGENAGLPGRVADCIAEALIVDIVSAQDVSVEQGSGRFGLGQAHGFVNQAHAGPPTVLLAEQEVPIAMNKEDLHAMVGQLAQCIGHALSQGIGRVVADPGLEQIAEDVEGTGAAGRAAQKVDQESSCLRPTCLEVQVGNALHQTITPGARLAQ